MRVEIEDSQLESGLPAVRSRCEGRAVGVGATLCVRGTNPFELFGERAVPIGADHEIGKGGLVEESLTHPLGHTSCDPDEETGLRNFQASELRHPPENSALGILPDRTGIHENDIRLFRRRDDLITTAGEHAFHELTISDIHLAAVRLYVGSPPHLIGPMHASN
jgi:hypothetical protein